jgi:hypothetical protein
LKAEREVSLSQIEGLWRHRPRPKAEISATYILSHEALERQLTFAGQTYLTGMKCNAPANSRLLRLTGSISSVHQMFVTQQAALHFMCFSNAIALIRSRVLLTKGGSECKMWTGLWFFLAFLHPSQPPRPGPVRDSYYAHELISTTSGPVAKRHSVFLSSLSISVGRNGVRCAPPDLEAWVGQYRPPPTPSCAGH